MQVPDLRIHVLDRPDKVAAFWEWLTRPDRKFIAWDTETTGLNQYAPGFKCRMIQFGDCTEGWAIPFQDWRGLVQAAVAWCARARVMMVSFNLDYDGVVLAVEGIKLDYSIQADVYFLARLGGFCDESPKLKAQGSKHLGPWAGHGEQILKTGMHNAGWTFENVPMGWRPYPIYGVMDTLVTALLWVKWQPRYERWRAQHDQEVAVCEMTAQMTRIGMKVDRSYLTAQSVEYQTEETCLLERLAVYGVEPSRGSTVLECLQNAGVFPDDALRTESGQLSVAEPVLARIDHPVARDVLRYRTVHHTRTVYLEGLLGFADADDLVHAQIRSMQALTGRMSIATPPLQQLPSGDEVVRRGVIGREPGHVIVSVDYEQIELRLWAAMTRDEALKLAIKEADASGLDFFTSLCRTIYQEPNFQKEDHRRKRVKSSTYTKLFTGGLKKAAETAGVSQEAMLPTWVMLGQRFPSLADNGSAMLKRGPDKIVYGMSPWDRRFAVQSADSAKNIPNYMCQGSAAITLKKAMVNLRAAGLADYLVVPVHDELVASVPEKEAQEVMHEMAEIMSAVIKEEVWGIDVPAKPGRGQTWAEAH